MPDGRDGRDADRADVASAADRRTSGDSQKRRFSGAGRFSFTPSASHRRIIAGRSAASASQQSRTPPPAIMPSCATPGNSVSQAAKKAMAEVSAPVRMPGPVSAAVSTRAWLVESVFARCCR